jgi:hypothetical protein
MQRTAMALSRDLREKYGMLGDGTGEGGEEKTGEAA